MKKIIYASVLVITSLIILSCDKAKARKSSFVTHYEYTESFTTGTWHISTFKINGKQHCQDFEGRSFCFTKQNLVSVRNAADKTYIGNWWVESDSASDDEPPIDLSFSMDFQREKPLMYLNGDWAILERSKDRLQLLLLDSDEREYVTFDKDNE